MIDVNDHSGPPRVAVGIQVGAHHRLTDFESTTRPRCPACSASFAVTPTAAASWQRSSPWPRKAVCRPRRVGFTSAGPRSLFDERIEIRDGRMWVPDRPGLGFTLSGRMRALTRSRLSSGPDRLRTKHLSRRLLIKQAA